MSFEGSTLVDWPAYAAARAELGVTPDDDQDSASVATEGEGARSARAREVEAAT